MCVYIYMYTDQKQVGRGGSKRFCADGPAAAWALKRCVWQWHDRRATDSGQEKAEAEMGKPNEKRKRQKERREEEAGEERVKGVGVGAMSGHRPPFAALSAGTGLIEDGDGKEEGGGTMQR
ncbi:hypothetical protein CDL15_Pgr027172 [Punica granatum]|uniref:Uncharacterized protein n=1 Tax=Punica granatum TaxID=22663 RepID=A0A218XAL5_PUNGR|nr:hypothetical protein CDL15_Pgr027172 [Punica granatum]